MPKTTTTKKTATSQPKNQTAKNKLKNPSTTTPSKNREALSTTKTESGGISLSTVDFNKTIPSDLTKPSSSIPETDQSETSSCLEAIEKQRNTVEIIRANLALTGDLVAAAILQTEVEGKLIDLQVSQVNNKEKLVRVDQANEKVRLAESKLEQLREQTSQQQIRTQGTVDRTESVRQEQDLLTQISQAKVENLRAKLQDLRTAQTQAFRNLSGD